MQNACRFSLSWQRNTKPQRTPWIRYVYSPHFASMQSLLETSCGLTWHFFCRFLYGMRLSLIRNMPSSGFKPLTSTVSLIRFSKITPRQGFCLFRARKLNWSFGIFQGHNLRGKEFNLTLHWHVMPKTGKMFADKIVMPGYSLPDAYKWWRLKITSKSFFCISFFFSFHGKDSVFFFYSVN